MITRPFLRLLAILLVACISLTSTYCLAATVSTVDSSGKLTHSNVPSWCMEDKGLGWSFYCDHEKQRQSKIKDKEPAVSSKYPYTKKVKQWRLRLDEARAKAILEPTMQNIIVYLTLQKQTLDQATSFAKGTQKALVEEPKLDYTLKHPQGKLAKQVWYDSQNKDMERTVKHLAGKRFGIFFFYRSSCPYCHMYAPILKAYSMRYGLHTVAISLDGGALPSFPHFVVDQGQFRRWHLKSIVPATVLFDSKTKKITPIGYGVLTQEDLSRRIFSLLEEEKANDW